MFHQICPTACTFFNFERGRLGSDEEVKENNIPRRDKVGEKEKRVFQESIGKQYSSPTLPHNTGYIFEIFYFSFFVLLLLLAPAGALIVLVCH